MNLFEKSLSKERSEKFCSDFLISEFYSIDSDGKINSDHVNLSRFKGFNLPVQFGSVRTIYMNGNDHFSGIKLNLLDFQGFPDSLEEMGIHGVPIRSFQGFPNHVSYISITNSPISLFLSCIKQNNKLPFIHLLNDMNVISKSKIGYSVSMMRLKSCIEEFQLDPKIIDSKIKQIIPSLKNYYIIRS